MAVQSPEMSYVEEFPRTTWTDLLPPEYLEQIHPQVAIDPRDLEQKVKDLLFTSRASELESDAVQNVLKNLSTESKLNLVSYLQGLSPGVDAETVLELDSTIGRMASDDFASRVGGYALEIVPALQPVDSDWKLKAECLKLPYDACFPDYEGNGGKTTNRAKAEIAAAKKICRSCVVRGECLEYALGNEEAYGIWAGLDPDELKEFRLVGTVESAKQ